MAISKDISKNLNAFLDMIAYAEGTIGRGDDGYNILVGGRTFLGYKDHPRIYNRNLNSTAAGRYQILQRYYDAYRMKLGLKDFEPESQDAIAIKLIEECGARKVIEYGDLRNAINKCKSRWASLPGAGYGQHEYTYKELEDRYLEYGGVLA